MPTIFLHLGKFQPAKVGIFQHVGARLVGVDLAHANICGADLSTAEDLTEEQLRKTEGDTFTKLPEEMRVPLHWAGKNPRRGDK